MANIEAWETFCDEGYFHMWAVRPVGSRAFKDAFHLPSRAEAERLRDLLCTRQLPVEAAVDIVSSLLEAACKADVAARVRALMSPAGNS